MTPAEYHKLIAARGGARGPGAGKRDEPEHGLQVACAGWLVRHLRPEVEWIGGAAGLRLGGKTLRKALDAGCLRPGWPDLSFLDEKGGAYIELKAESSLSAAQRRFRDFCRRCGHRWALCRSLSQLIDVVTGWGMVVEGCR